MLVEEQDIGLDAGLVEDASGQAKKCVEIKLLQQTPADALACAEYDFSGLVKKVRALAAAPKKAKEEDT